MSCFDAPTGNEYWFGLTEMPSNAAALTVSAVLPVIPWKAADTCATPRLLPVAIPWTLTLTLSEDELHIADWLRF